MGKVKVWLVLAGVCIFSVSLTGCAVNIYKIKPEDKQTIASLSEEVEYLKAQSNELDEAKRMLEQRLAAEISDKKVKLNMAERGLVITVTDEILFDSGKADIKAGATNILDTVAAVITEKVSDKDVGVEGHTDSQPIKHSKWKSNWELSAARATSVLHYLVNECSLDPHRMVAIGYGQYKPVASNDTKVGRQKNRRVEILIMPRGMKKIQLEEAEDFLEEQENFIK